MTDGETRRNGRGRGKKKHKNDENTPLEKSTYIKLCLKNLGFAGKKNKYFVAK